jgi:hypothetical protein
MPWQEVVTVELRQQFVRDALRRMVPVRTVQPAQWTRRVHLDTLTSSGGAPLATS